ncbi:MAG: DEAD/DEAH box helicase, partial [Euryarchaeota archaeon]|nr:DEAD/DEAH box helicase [Euryarchaeota archaeon]
ALVLTPTRELACQIEDNFSYYGQNLDLTLGLIYGGVGYGAQRKAIKEGADVIIATPGRLIDHIQQKSLRLDKIEILILDEVDRMLDMGFIEDVRKIVKFCPKKRQTLMFSATMPDSIKHLADWALHKPAEVNIDLRVSAADTVDHALYPVDAMTKFDLLIHILEKINRQNTIIFFQTKAGADRIAKWLKQHGNNNIAVMHSDLQQRERAKALQDFKDGNITTLIATDIASRGLDVRGVQHVINYDVPQHSEDYVHRIGRTGRAKTEGEAYTLFSPDQMDKVQAIENFIGQEIPRRVMEGFHYRIPPMTETPGKPKPAPQRRGLMGRGGKFKGRPR